jgi:hypothetical protein
MDTQAPSGRITYPEFLRSPVRCGKALRDNEGRPLGEGNSPPEIFSTVVTEWRSCPYPGSRHKNRKPMNVAALKQVLQNWDELAGFMLSFRSEFISRWGSQELNASDLWTLTFMASMLPHYLTTRKSCPVPDGQLPVTVAAAFKVLLGVFQTMGHMTFTRVAAGKPLDVNLLPEDILAHADANGIFESVAGVCAAPPELIKRFLSVLDGHAEADQSAFNLQRLLEDTGEFFAYAAAATQLELAKCVFNIKSTYLECELSNALRDVATARERGGFETGATLQLALDHFSHLPNFGLRTLVCNENSAEAENRISSFLWRELTNLDKIGGFERSDLTRLDPGAATSDADVTSIARVLGSGANARSESDPETRDILAAALAGHMQMEQRALRLFCFLQRRIDELMGRPLTDPFNHTDMLQAFGPTSFESVATWLDVFPEDRIRHAARECVGRT